MSDAISAEIPDWDRERPDVEFRSGQRLIRSLRRYKWAQSLGIWGAVPRILSILEHRVRSLITSCEIPLNTNIAGGLVLPHPNGIVIHPDTQIGPNCIIFHQVTLGTVGTHRPGAPMIGGNVQIGAGAKVLGGVTIGNHAKIGANAVVTCDVPAGCTAVGVPARIIRPADPATTEPEPSP